jgi:hypothetical protein
LIAGRTLVPLVFLALIVVGGAYVRLAGLGEPDFYNDELYMVYAATALERGEGPLLPSGEHYGRGLDITRLVGFALRHIDHAETAARLPSAVLGILGLLMFAAIAWAMAGPWAAVGSALLLAIYPEAISQSRITRFYTYQLCFGLVAFYAGWRAVRSAGLPDPEGTPRRAYSRELGWAFLALLGFALAARVQPTALSIAVGWGLCMALGAAADLMVRGRAGWRTSARVQVVALGLLGLLVTTAVFPALLTSVLDLATAVPRWAGGEPADPRGYYWALLGTYPVVVALLPVCIIATAFHNARLAGYLALWFLVPFTLHSLVLPWKAERYLLLAMPAFFMLAAVPAALGCQALFKRTQATLRQAGVPRMPSSSGAAAAVAIVVVTAVLATPAFHAARKIPPFVVDVRWRTAWALIEALPDADSVVLGSSYPIASLYYWGRTDFGVSTVSLERVPLPGDDERRWGRWVNYEDGVPDYYSAAPVLTHPQTIRARFEDAGATVIAIDRGHLAFGHVDRSLLDTLLGEAVELCHGSCGRLLLFYWPWEPAVRGASLDAISPAAERPGATLFSSLAPSGNRGW